MAVDPAPNVATAAGDGGEEGEEQEKGGKDGATGKGAGKGKKGQAMLARYLKISGFHGADRDGQRGRASSWVQGRRH